MFTQLFFLLVLILSRALVIYFLLCSTIRCDMKSPKLVQGFPFIFKFFNPLVQWFLGLFFFFLVFYPIFRLILISKYVVGISISSLSQMITLGMVMFCLMHRKFDALEKFKEFRVELEKWLGKCLETQSNQSKEYMSNEFNFFLREHDIISQLSAPGIPQ